MSTLITQLRGKCEAGTADYSIAGVAYWTDDQLQTVLDYNRTQHNNAIMSAVPYIGAGGTISYTEYRTGITDWESDPVIQDDNYNTLGTATYSFNAQLGIVTFTADTQGHTRYITGKSYNVDAAAASIWNSKAAHYAIAVDVSTDNMSIKRGDIIAHCKQMALLYGQAGNGGSVYMERMDV